MTTLEIGDRILITEETKHLILEGYNWVGSCPIVSGIGEKDVAVRQFGYPVGFFMLSLENALRMRDDFLKWVEEQEQQKAKDLEFLKFALEEQDGYWSKCSPAARDAIYRCFDFYVSNGLDHDAAFTKTVEWINQKFEKQQSESKPE